ncbi:MAG: MbtH family protein, partial [Vicinamibacterales bacterium]
SGMSELVQRLATGEHRVEISLRPERTVAALKQCIDRGYVHVRFTETRGGTELGIPLDRERTDLSSADFEHGTGHLVLAGALTLDYVNVRCIATIRLPELEGQGRLELIGASVPSGV